MNTPPSHARPQTLYSSLCNPFTHPSAQEPPFCSKSSNLQEWVERVVCEVETLARHVYHSIIDGWSTGFDTSDGAIGFFIR